MTEKKNLESILKAAKGFMESQILLTAFELDLFNLIGENIKSAKEISKVTGSSERGIAILLDALAALGFVTKNEEVYANTPIGLRHLVKDGDDYRGATLAHILRMRDMWLRLSQAVKTGTSPRTPGESLVSNRERNRSFILAMRDSGRTNAGIIAENLDLSAYRRLVDLGGGPGTYSIEIIKRFPDIRSTLVDLPLTLEVAAEVIADEGMSDRIELKECDFFSHPDSDIGSGYDVALVSNVLHIESEDRNRKVLKNVFGAMAEEGMIIIHETIIDESRISPPDRALFAVNMLVHTERGNCYTFSEIKSWLEDAGFENIEFVDCFDRPSLIVGYKKIHREH